ncbi:MAG: transglycosylase domain-containing protein [bacterium]
MRSKTGRPGSRRRAVLGSGLKRALRRPLVRILLGAALVLALAWTALRLAPYDGEERLASLEFSRIYMDRAGREIAIRPVGSDGLRRIHLAPAELPPELPRIVRRAEDARFFFHPGVDPISILRATYQYVARGETVSGASTITMQLASILHPRPNTATGKLAEMIDALQLETRFSKREILALYASLVPMGYNVEGFAAAARLFYGRALSDLGRTELAILAAIPRNPSANDPWREPEANLAAARRILGTGTADRDPASEQSIQVLDPRRDGVWPFEAPHFVEFAARASGRESGPAEGGARSDAPEPAAGPADRWVVRTTLDLEVQRHLERLLRSTVSGAQRYRISNAAGILVDAETAEILAYAGSADFFASETSGQIDGVQIRREPGSTLKPFLYAEAFEMGFTPATVVPDIPLEFGGEEVYVPENFNEQYHGPVRIREALAASLNVPAVATLERISVSRFADRLVELGFESITAQRGELGVSLALGGADVSLYELVQGYLSFYANGSSRQLTPFVRTVGTARDHHWDPATASMIRGIISSNDDRVMTFGLRSPLRFDFPVAAKTGTSNQFTNIWAVAFSANVAGGVWMGNFGGETVMGTPGSSLPATVLHELVTAYSTGDPLPESEGLHEARICTLSGMGATSACPNTVIERLPRHATPEPCDWHQPGGAVEYPQEYRLWAEQYGYRLSYQREADLDIVTPVDGAVFYIDPGAPADSQQIRFFLTGTGSAELLIGDQRLFQGELPASVFWGLQPGTHLVRLRQPETVIARRIEVR